MKSIYKITNNINGKFYIGQSSNPAYRFNQHMLKHSSSKSISQDVDKYGRGNFTLEIIEENIDNFQEREKYWINYYNDNKHELYNKTKGGEEPPTFMGEDSPTCKYSDTQLFKVIDLVQNTYYTFTKIAQITQTSSDFVRKVNAGRRAKPLGLSFPIRKENHFDKIAKLIITDLKNPSLSQREIAKKYGVARSTVTMINIGAHRFDENIKYPIRIGTYPHIIIQNENEEVISCEN
jgi:group I intron endonuclease